MMAHSTGITITVSGGVLSPSSSLSGIILEDLHDRISDVKISISFNEAIAWTRWSMVYKAGGLCRRHSDNDINIIHVNLFMTLSVYCTFSVAKRGTKVEFNRN